MLGVIRQSTYQANLRPLHSEFYDFCERDDELAAPLIAKSIRRLLKKAPVLLTNKQNLLEQESLPHSFPDDRSSKWPLHVTRQVSEDCNLFHSDSSISSNCSSLSSDSFASSSSLSSISSRSSLSDFKKKQKQNRRVNVEVVLPNDMMNRLVRDIVRMAEGESDGIRGCQLQIEVTDSENDISVSVGKINCDPKILPKSIMRVNLVSIPPPPEALGSQILINRLLGSSVHNIYIKPGYTIEKRKVNPDKHRK